jgi:hypothetical protein
MSQPRGGLKILHLMILVVVAGVSLVYYIDYQYASRYDRLAAYHDQKWAEAEKPVEGRCTWVEHPHPALADYHARMSRKYRHAARNPWVPVTPDPPEPD